MTTTLVASTLPAALQDAVRRRGDAIFLRHGSGATPYRTFAKSVDHVASGLLAQGLGPGDRIGLLALNQVEWLQLFFAATQIGAAVVGMSLRYRDGELLYMMQDSQVKAIALLPHYDGLNFAAMLDRLSPRLPTLQRLIVLDPPEGEVPPPALDGVLPRLPFARLLDGEPDRDALQRAGAAVDASSLAMVIYTSGTTGRPKGAGLTHGSMLASARAQAHHTRVTERDLLPLPLPLNHVGGITCGVLTIMTGGGTVDLIPEFKALAVLERMRLHPPTLMGGVPTMLTLLLMKSEDLDIDFSSLRLIYAGGSNVDATLLLQLSERIPQATLMNLYGLSESSGAIVMTPWHASREDLMGTIGCTIGNGRVRVVDPVTGDPLPDGEVGELCFTACGVVPGYVGAAQSTSAFGKDGWLRSGDLGQVDARGVIMLKGRAKDMYIQGGFNVYPAEVEAHILSHPDVLMTAGIGVPHPVLGETGRYYVVRRPDCLLGADELRAWCAEALADYKVPREFIFRDDLPLTPAGKIHKAALRDEGP